MAMMTEYDGPQVSSVAFKMNINGTPMSFRLPCNWRAVHEVLKNDMMARKKGFTSQEQAIMTAWRVIYVWVKAQMALVEINMVTIPQIFLPYAIMRDGKTLAEHVESNPSFLLSN